MRSATAMVLGGVVTAIAGVASLVAVATWPGTEEDAPAAIPAPMALTAPELTSTLPPAVETSRGVAATGGGSAPVELLGDGPVRARRLVVARAVDQREPVGASEVFELGDGDRIYAFVEAVNETAEPVTLTVTFEPESGETTGHVALEIPAGAARFRTWAFTRNIARRGEWQAVVRGPDGAILARRPFVVE